MEAINITDPLSSAPNTPDACFTRRNPMYTEEEDSDDGRGGEDDTIEMKECGDRGGGATKSPSHQPVSSPF